LVDEVRTSFEGLKIKESDCRKLSSELELLRANLAKVEGRWRESEDKIRSLNRSYQAESEEMRKKEQSFKRIKESVTSSIWKA
jgi:predicted  nucleic acid-binding Zn-ribbon protein